MLLDELATLLEVNAVETELLIWVLLLLLELPCDVVSVDVKTPFGLLLAKKMLLTNGAVAEYGVPIAILVVGRLLLPKPDNSGFSALILDDSILE